MHVASWQCLLGISYSHGAVATTGSSVKACRANCATVYATAAVVLDDFSSHQSCHS